MLIEIPVNELLPTVEVLTTSAGEVAGVRLFFLPGGDRQSISLLTATEDDRERLKAILQRARHVMDYRPPLYDDTESALAALQRVVEDGYATDTQRSAAQMGIAEILRLRATCTR